MTGGETIGIIVGVILVGVILFAVVIPLVQPIQLGIGPLQLLIPQGALAHIL